MREPPIPEPAFESWSDYLHRTTTGDRHSFCVMKARRANRPFRGRAPVAEITAYQVGAILDAAKGRCAHCGSLAVESRPYAADGSPLMWDQIGRRIGALDGTDWSCLWCATWPTERIPGARDHGAIQT